MYVLRAILFELGSFLFSSLVPLLGVFPLLIYLQPFQFSNKPSIILFTKHPVFFLSFFPHIDEDGGQDFLYFPA
jgi:hypothetical protein